MCREWKEIALITREKVFKETEQGEIDLFDVKVKLCLFITLLQFLLLVLHFYLLLFQLTAVSIFKGFY